jgi:hypothetical protein
MSRMNSEICFYKSSGTSCPFCMVQVMSVLLTHNMCCWSTDIKCCVQCFLCSRSLISGISLWKMRMSRQKVLNCCSQKFLECVCHYIAPPGWMALKHEWTTKLPFTTYLWLRKWHWGQDSTVEVPALPLTTCVIWFKSYNLHDMVSSFVQWR